ncbi:hypothetical protein K493DRAFT_306022 [Basidiobolus meristosporus CBS 931.73]|uniref:Fe2OG dioxygenase domain-containing protein n=1 Tax=Basidiobolus meristosporus CBS 931.73 TaxID=1314790 RepID=A0A1Y1XUH9_9FUNG|nr:hypothetical protein K493DRAFT_306022 [Basidiobolus meristosporus CBS 931.73]|eukprot:ORX89146.1 hypothetical protein K493DRAFT_306022 [Basidiobolus meristosporus CBS 931.73]
MVPIDIVAALELDTCAFFVVLDDIYSKEECDRLIRKSEYHGFNTYQTNKYGGIVNSPHVRNDLNLAIIDGFETFELWSRIKDHVPKYWTDNPVSGLHKNLRFNQYRPGQYFNAHVDSSYVDEQSSGASRITVLLYLNDVAEGGQTRFFSVESMKHIDIIPKPGRVVLFEHGLYHASLAVKQGVKYVLHTDVMYTKPQPLPTPRTLAYSPFTPFTANSSGPTGFD